MSIDLSFINDDDERERVSAYFANVGKKKTKKGHEEYGIQVKCFAWFNRTYPDMWHLFFTIKNDGAKRVITGKDGRKVPIGGIRDKAMGVKAGVSDTFFALSRGGYHGFFIELKTPVGKQSDDQKDFESAVVAAGYKYSLARSLEEFQQQIKSYLAL